MPMRRLAALCLSVVLAVTGLLMAFHGVRAAPALASQPRFVTTGGSGHIFCSQADPCQLPIALLLANPGDTLYLEQGTYTGTGAAVITVTLSITLFGGWSGNPIGQPMVDPAAFPTRIDGQGSRRGIFISSGISPTVDGFVIQNGDATGLVASCSLDSPAGCGGGMFVDHAAAQILNNTFVSNTALITTTDLVQGYGGGLLLEWADGSVISGNVFFKNSASRPLSETAGSGGGMAVTGPNPSSVLIQNNTFTANTAYWGGGLALESTENAQVVSNLFENNTATHSGGGLYAWIATGAATGNTLRGNSGDSAAYLGYFGGTFGANLLVDNQTNAGLLLFDDYLSNNIVVYNNILAHNGSTGILASGYISFPLNVLLLNNTLVGSGPGSGLLLADGFVTVTADNTLISGFSTGMTISYPLTSAVTAYYTLFDTNVAATGNASFSHTVFGAAGFIDPAHRNYHIGFNSAARDSGGPTFLSTDFDGDPRPLGAANDIGADETRFNYGSFLPLVRR